MIADWAELRVLYDPDHRIPLEAIRTRLDSDGSLADEIDELSDEDPDEMREQEASERLAANVLAEIKRRREVCGSAYPFQIADGYLNLVGNRWDAYKFCLLVADREHYHSRDHETPLLFEHLTRAAVAAYLGGEAVRFGSHRDTMPVGVDAALTCLSSKIGALRVDGFPVQSTDNDLGLDVAGWKAFPDERPGKLKLFVQCATGIHWRNKKHDLDMERWKGILYMYVTPLTGMAIPYVLADETDWRRQTSGLILFDRLRISSCLDGHRLPPGHNWAQWCKQRIREGRERLNFAR